MYDKAVCECVRVAYRLANLIAKDANKRPLTDNIGMHQRQETKQTFSIMSDISMYTGAHAGVMCGTECWFGAALFGWCRCNKDIRMGSNDSPGKANKINEHTTTEITVGQ